MTSDCTFFDKSTSFRGRITATDLVVEGSVTGEISASRQVTILNGASVNGPIRTTRILMEEGGRHEGAIRLSGEEYDSADEWTTEDPEPVRDERRAEREEPDPDPPRLGGETKAEREEKREERLW